MKKNQDKKIKIKQRKKTRPKQKRHALKLLFKFINFTIIHN